MYINLEVFCFTCFPIRQGCISGECMYKINTTSLYANYMNGLHLLPNRNPTSKHHIYQMLEALIITILT